ncbi:hypothetical protein HW532_02415 [Kaustia mangrovi]|uniref:Uncharacterized protein n=1 Tax=Kaustia mangrovi TaxID=2593653 RepID=A0A7S8C1K5_9HYPH|nr:hypothetical protein [Kaustia mangrovi]QPC41676.1 hypothetical protein HW532_02415 [Kaustia mangrovi]
MTTLSKIIFAIPLIGWMLRSAWYGDDSEKVFFCINIVVFWGLAIYAFGYPALIIPALTVTGVYLVSMIALTARDI